MAILHTTKILGDLSVTGQTISTVATGTAPFVITSTTTVPNLSADLLDGQDGSYYQPASTAITTSNIGTQTVEKANKLTTARTIGGVSFNGTTDIDLPGVNISGTQDTSGNAGTVTKGVYTIGDQVIAGAKTFTQDVTIGSAAVK